MRKANFEEITFETPKPQSVWERPVPILVEDNVIHAYISDQIDYPFNYDELTHTLLYRAAEGSTVVLHINTPGGLIDSANQIADAMTKSKAHVVAHLTGTVASAGTMLTMHADEIIVSNGCSFMIHNYSSGIQGKGHEIKAQQNFVDSELNIYFRQIYGGFLTDSEIRSVINGKDMWMGRDEILARWANRRYLRPTLAIEPPPATPAKRGRPRKNPA